MDTVLAANDTWDVVRQLGKGGMGQTLLVQSQMTGQLAVLKELHVGHLDNWKALELFEREAALLQALDHPGVPAYLDAIDEGEGTRALLQSFVDGKTLLEIIREDGPFSPGRFEDALRDCLDILEYLHTHVPPVVHRDITPANVMLDADRAYIIDFGSVKWALRDSTQMTSVGTFGYMAPEQIRGRAEPASDMFSLGMTFVALATRMDPSEFAVDPSSGQVQVREMLNLPGHLVDVLDRMTRPGLGERLSSPKRALALLDDPAPLARSTSAPHQSSQTRQADPHQPKRGAMVAAAAVLAMGLAGFAVFVGQTAVEPKTEAAAPAIADEVLMPELPMLPDGSLRKPDVGAQRIERNQQPANRDADAGGSRR